MSGAIISRIIAIISSPRGYLMLLGVGRVSYRAVTFRETEPPHVVLVLRNSATVMKTS